MFPPQQRFVMCPIRNRTGRVLFGSDVLNFRSNSERMEGLISPASHLYSRGCDVEEDCGDERRRIDILAPGHGRARGDLPSLRGGRCDGRRARQADLEGSAVAAIHDLQVVTIAYTSFKRGQDSGGEDDDDGISTSAVGPAGGNPSSGQPDSGKTQFWTELFYRTSNESAWALYMPPWNPDGRWFGVRDSQHEGAVTGLIPFDTSYTGGETHYGFTTAAVHTKYGREPISGEKANTTVDSHAPQLFIASATPGGWTNRNVLHWIAQDASSGVASVIVSLDGTTPLHFTTAEGETELSLNAGDHAVQVTATDRAGNSVDVTVPFHFDPTAPSLSVTSPTRGSYVKTKDVDVSWTESDAGSGLASLQLSLDSAPPVELPLDATSYTLAGL